MGQPDIYKRAEGYGMPGEQFDGFDPLATYDAVARAMDRIERRLEERAPFSNLGFFSIMIFRTEPLV